MRYCLKFPDEATAIEMLSQFRGKNENDEDVWITGSHEHALDVIGVITRILPDESTEVLAGWHVNFIGELPEAALPYLVEPTNPVRVWL